MDLFYPDAPNLKARLELPDTLLVVCYCAAWCDTCTAYRPKLAELARSRPEHVFVWVDIEDDPDLLDDEDVENFPTILIERNAKPLFFGTILPHIGQLERMIDAFDGAHVDVFEEAAPQDVRSRLLAYTG